MAIQLGIKRKAEIGKKWQKMQENGNKMAIVLTQSHLASARTVLNIPQGYDFVEFGKVGLVDVATNNNVVEVNIKKHGLVTIVFKKMK